MKLICIGDSITYGQGGSNENINYPNILSKLLNCQVDNYGVKGSTICKNGSEDNQNKSIENRVSTIDFKSYTHCLIMGGTNDWANNFNLTSVYESLIKIFQTIYLSNNNIEILFFTPFYRNNWYKGDSNYKPNDNGIYLKEFVNIIIKCCLKNRVKCCNLYLVSGFNESNYKAYYIDGLHPNDDGYYKLTNIIYKRLQGVL